MLRQGVVESAEQAALTERKRNGERWQEERLKKLGNRQ